MQIPIETRTVSPKTLLDGRLEVSPETFGRLAALEETLRVVVGDESNSTAAERARLESMTCACAKGGTLGHDHHFLQAKALQRLTAYASVRLLLDEAAATVRIVAVVTTGS